MSSVDKISNDQRKRALKNINHVYLKKPKIIFSIIVEAVQELLGGLLASLILAMMIGYLSADEIDKARNAVFIWLAVMVLSQTIKLVGQLIGIHSENNIYSEQAAAFYMSLVNKDMEMYRSSHTGEITSAFRSFLDGQLLVVRQIRDDFTPLFIQAIGPIVVLTVFSYALGAITAMIVVVQCLYMKWATSKNLQARREAKECYKRIAGRVSDDVTNIIAFKSSGAEELSSQHLLKDRELECKIFWRRRKTELFLNYPRAIITILFFALAVLVALNDGGSGAEQVTLVVLIIRYVFGVARAMDRLPDQLNRFDDHLANIEMNMEIMDKDYYEDIKDAPNAVEINFKKADIEFKDVSFFYNNDEAGEMKVLENFNLKIECGQRVGVVGLSGAGKTTVANLLMRFDDVVSGEIMINGRDIRQLKQSSLRRNISYVPQEPMLFHRSVADNMTYGLNKINQSAIIRAAKAAHIHYFIDSLPNKYDTIVGERGIKLSGGQKQRVVIARAILKNAPIMLFDEATSALDTESEEIIQKALPEIIGNHTAIVIAHRLSTVSKLDRIIVLENGKIVEDGTHTQLIRQKARYYSLWQKQGGGKR